MIDDIDGSGDGEWGKLICVMGTRADVGTDGWTEEASTTCDAAGNIGAGNWPVVTAGTTGSDSRGKPPNPGRPRDGCGGVEPDGPLSMAATRMARSPI
jgi:hypothetical protein